MGFNVFQSEYLPIRFDKMIPDQSLNTIRSYCQMSMVNYRNILIFTVIKQSGSDVNHNLLLTDIPLDTWMSIVVSYDQDSSTVSLMRDCWHKNSESIDPDVIYDININNLKVGRAPTNGYAHCKYM